MNLPEFAKNIIFPALILLLFSSCQSLPPPTTHGWGVYHSVQNGQTMYSIAKAYGKSVQSIASANRIWDPTALKAGTRLWIPGATNVIKVPTTVRTARKPEPPQKPQKSKPPSRRKPVKGFLKWPLKGTVTSTFGNRNGRNHDGIDIGAPKGTPIFAAAAGKVVFSGWGPKGYGLLVIIKHRNHLASVYAHNSRNWVKKGQQVKQGQKIASVGSTGRSTGPHLHFEVRNDTHPRNPLKFLPAKR